MHTKSAKDSLYLDMHCKYASTSNFLNDQFPITFPNGYQVDTIGFWCRRCSEIAPPSKVRGQISRLVEGTADIRAFFDCHCGHRSEYLIRLKDDRSYSYLDEQGWHTETGRRTIWQRLRIQLVHLTMLVLISCKYRRIGRRLKSIKNRLQSKQREELDNR